LLAVLKHAMYISTGIFQSSGRKSFTEHSHPPLPRRSATRILLGVADDLGVHVLGDLADEAHSDADDLLCVEAGEVAQDLVGARGVREGQKRTVSSTYLGLFKMSVLIKTSCATMQSKFKCGPYANKKSHSCRTSGSGGVHAHMVKTDAKA
jgi:hypothetical protein